MSWPVERVDALWALVQALDARGRRVYPWMEALTS